MLYLITVPFVIYMMDGININSIFKKNRVVQARLFYLSLCLKGILLIDFQPIKTGLIIAWTDNLRPQSSAKK